MEAFSSETSLTFAILYGDLHGRLLRFKEQSILQMHRVREYLQPSVFQCLGSLV
jgi:hypothetical protein